MLKTFLINGAGLGDCFIRYFGLVPGEFLAWRRLAALKRSTNCYTKVVLPVHNPAIIDFFRYHPHIDEIQFVNYSDDWHRWSHLLTMEGWTDIETLDLPCESSTLYLSSKDEEWFQSVTGGKPYVVVHPYAGVPERGLVNYLDFSGFNLPVFVIGASSYRSFENGSSYYREFVPPDKKGRAIDLTGVCNSRLACLLISRAAHFHGSFSAYAWAALGCGTPSTIYIPRDYPEDDHVQLIRRLGVNLHYSDQFPVLPADKSKLTIRQPLYLASPTAMHSSDAACR